jgi:hypothetical protein
MAVLFDYARVKQSAASFSIKQVKVKDVIVDHFCSSDGVSETSVQLLLDIFDDLNSATTAENFDEADDVMPGAGTLVGSYQLPPQTSQTMIGRIKAHRHRPMIVVLDHLYQVHALLMGQSIFVIFTRMWWIAMEGDTVHISPISRAESLSPEIVNCKARGQWHCAMLSTVSGLDVDDQLDMGDEDVAKTSPLFSNNTGKMLVPHSRSKQMHICLRRHLHEEPVLVIFDQYGRIQYALVNNSIHVVMMPLWCPVAILTTYQRIICVEKASDAEMHDVLLTAHRPGGIHFTLPHGLPAEIYEHWKPDGGKGGKDAYSGHPYCIKHTSDNRVMSITRTHRGAQGLLDDADGDGDNDDDETLLETCIKLSDWWDRRYTLRLVNNNVEKQRDDNLDMIEEF